MNSGHGWEEWNWWMRRWVFSAFGWKDGIGDLGIKVLYIGDWRGFLGKSRFTTLKKVRLDRLRLGKAGVVYVFMRRFAVEGRLCVNLWLRDDYAPFRCLRTPNVGLACMIGGIYI